MGSHSRDVTTRRRRITWIAASATVVVTLAGCTAAATMRDDALPAHRVAVAGRATTRLPGASGTADATSAADPSGSPDATGSAVPDASGTGTVAASKAVTRALSSPCPKRHSDQTVIVSLAEQHMWLCHRDDTVRTFPITSGRATHDTRTPTGHYRIQGLNRNTVLTLSSGRTYDVKYWIPFDAPNFGFHDAPWQHVPFGSDAYRTHGSHGCVHMPLAAIRFLYNWVDMGTRVFIRS